jgi:hypothetical protein
MMTNEEKSAALAAEARVELVRSAGEDWRAAKALATAAAESELEALRLFRQAGIKLQEAAGRESPKFEFFRQSELPKDLSFSGLKFCVYLARLFEEAPSLDAARSARQRMFESVGVSKAPKRVEPQRCHDVNPWNEFVSRASSFTGAVKKLGVESLEEWDEKKVRTFVRETRPIVEIYLKAANVTLQPSGPDAAAEVLAGEDLAAGQPTLAGLTSEERRELARCVAVIEKGKRVFLEVGEALVTVHEGRLFRETHPSMEAWVRERFGWTGRRARQLMAAAQTVKALAAALPEFLLPASEALTRPLEGLLPAEASAAWEEAVATAPAGGLTKKHVESVVRARQARLAGVCKGGP